jgi:hypothetical protein
LQNPLPHECKRNLLPKEKVLSMEDEGRWKEYFLGTHPSSTTVPSPLREGKGDLLDDGFCNFTL